MARSNAETVDEYLSELGPVRRDAMTVVHNTILERLTDGYQEATNYGKISPARFRWRHFPRHTTKSRFSMPRWRLRRTTCRRTS